MVTGGKHIEGFFFFFFFGGRALKIFDSLRRHGLN
jgi:hypothetical protein